ncbi:hypothetical protein BcepF1.079 [Burkholderia phage BcepF1]|uniref:Uncharacterized protein n=1 Tax=Burkholderia phage BcepF1 TaxID=2886897 RepID=A1YZY3_9CAUD|nr:DNA helicase [Burkholderia phage BcepF1]ABL96810.1 hypothetical protein BcepF1.079 [Burkholderia phage BcepF1]
MARKPEQQLYDNFKKYAEHNLLFHRVENLMMNGMSDMIVQNKRGITAWVENKAIEAWPVRSNTVPLRRAFQPGQLGFLREWREWGGDSFVMLRVGKSANSEYLLLDPRQPLDYMSQGQIRDRAVIVCGGMKDIVKFFEQLGKDEA